MESIGGAAAFHWIVGGSCPRGGIGSAAASHRVVAGCGSGALGRTAGSPGCAAASPPLCPP
eukprot:10566925-Prorocentrum_lima.AAC.1